MIERSIVYLADDLRHSRRVALKVLKPELAAVVGADRFLSEIQTTANLQHPHILPLFDSGEADGFLFFVMPYIEGETLADKLAREKQLPVDEAVGIATAVASALSVAHEQGVIHRDIKPGNVLLSRGEPLVSDFGIAIAVTSSSGARLTETGLSVGTPFYMSPEQATGDRVVTATSDVYALGCVLYEMLVGEPPYVGNTAQAVLGKILTEKPRTPTSVRAVVPPNVEGAVLKALEKLPADRFTSATGFAQALQDSGFRYGEKAHVSAGQAPAPLGRWLPWGIAAAALALFAWSLLPEPPAPTPPPFRMTLSDFVVEGGGGRRLDISRDGSTLIASGTGDQLYVRRSDDTEFRPIPGTEQGRRPAISPDGEWLAFVQGSGIQKVLLRGGPVLPVVSPGSFPHWYAQDEIVYFTEGSVYRVSSAGGEGTLIADETGPRPFMLPGGRAILHDGPDGLYLRVPGEDEGALIASGGSNGRYVPTGHILFGDRELQSVLAVPFDLDALQVTGPPVPVLPSVNIFGGGAVQLAVSDNGTLVHGLSVSSGSGGEARLTWFDMEGSRTDLQQVFNRGQVEFPRVSPDGTNVAFADEDLNEVVVYNLNTGEQTQVTEGGSAAWPAWAPDGNSLYVTGFLGNRSWMRIAPDGSGVLEEMEAGQGPIIAVSPDGTLGVVEDQTGENSPDLWIARMGGDSVEMIPYLRASWHEEEGAVSPDGRWLAYTSSEEGPHRVYIRSFPEPGPAVQVSIDQGGAPVWAPDGSAIYYRGDVSFMRREVRLSDVVELGEETALFALAGTQSSNRMRMHDIHPDGSRFIFVTTGDAPEESGQPIQGMGPVVVVVNWFQELRERMGEGS